MDTIEAISTRRSIRKFTNTPIPEEDLDRIMKAAIEAPSGKNNQPWKFVIVREDRRAEMVRIMREGISSTKDQGRDTGSSEWSAIVMENAPVTVFVFNPFGTKPWLARSIEQNFHDLVNVQSVGAAIQNMLLAARDLGIGSLWICDVFYAYEELCNWLGEDCQMVAAVSFGYADENPDARPRKPLSEVMRVL